MLKKIKKELIIMGFSLVAILTGFTVGAEDEDSKIDTTILDVNNSISISDFENSKNLNEVQIGITTSSSNVPTRTVMPISIDKLNYLKDELTIKKETISITSKEDIIKFYSNIYSLDYEMVYNKILLLTDNFRNDYYHKTIMDSTTLKDRSIDITSMEMGLMLLIRDMYFNTYKFDFNKSINTNIEYIVDLTEEQIIGKTCDLIGISPELTYGICSLESGHFTSRRWLEENNPSGLIFNGKWVKMPSSYAGILEQSLESWKYTYDNKHTLREIAEVHLTGTPDETSNWENIVEEFMEKGYNNQNMFDYPKVITGYKNYPNNNIIKSYKRAY